MEAVVATRQHLDLIPFRQATEAYGALRRLVAGRWRSVQVHREAADGVWVQTGLTRRHRGRRQAR